MYSANGAHGVNPAFRYSERAGAYASIVPVSRLTRVIAAVGCDREQVVEQGAADPLTAGCLGDVHRLQLAVRRVELLERSEAEQPGVAACAEQRHPRIEQTVEVEGVDVLERAEQCRERQVPFEQTAHVVGAGVVDGDHDGHVRWLAQIAVSLALPARRRSTGSRRKNQQCRRLSTAIRLLPPPVRPGSRAGNRHAASDPTSSASHAEFESHVHLAES